MKQTNKISTKIKIIGALLVILMLSTLGATIYLNQQNTKDALIINIAGKQRMLTQKIAKNIFYMHYNSNKDYYELNSAVDEFILGLDTLKHGDKSIGISPVPTAVISAQINKINSEWANFYEDIQNFKLLSNEKNKNILQLNAIVINIYKNNPILLNSVDKLVTMYTDYSEEKTSFIKTFQYISGLILFTIFLYSLLQLRSIEAHVDTFMQYSKMLLSENSDKLTPIKLEAESESEIIEVSDTINSFVQKINSAMECSNEALLHSQEASLKLEELTDEFDLILDELEDKSLMHKHLNNSEDIVIESTESLINSTSRLQKLKEELEKLTKSCKTSA